MSNVSSMKLFAKNQCVSISPSYPRGGAEYQQFIFIEFTLSDIPHALLGVGDFLDKDISTGVEKIYTPV